jgi:hypothetical protein
MQSFPLKSVAQILAESNVNSTEASSPRAEKTAIVVS